MPSFQVQVRGVQIAWQIQWHYWQNQIWKWLWTKWHYSCMYQQFFSATSPCNWCLHRWPPCVAVATTSYCSSDCSSDPCQPRRSFCVSCTTATHCFTASLKVWWAGCHLFRMRLHVWCLAVALSGINTSRHCYRSCTGFRLDVEWISRWPPWSTCHCLAGSSLYRSQLSVGLRWRSSSAAFFHIKVMCCKMDL